LQAAKVQIERKMPNYFTDDDLRSRVKADLERGRYRNHAHLARVLGISEPFLSQWLSGVRPYASEIMLDRLKLERARYYRSL
jgi:DNA-binding transcriptional regulator YdaS (Cro superfamily)